MNFPSGSGGEEDEYVECIPLDTILGDVVKDDRDRPKPPHPAVKTIWETGTKPLVDLTSPVIGIDRKAAPLPIVGLPPPPPPRITGGVRLPPPEFDHHYEGKLTIRMVESIESMRLLCRQPWGATTIGCAYRRNEGDSCDIYLMDDAFMARHNQNMSELLRHEVGHCNGWPNDHRGALP
jgi:hypothetical protein